MSEDTIVRIPKAKKSMANKSPANVITQIMKKARVDPKSVIKQAVNQVDKVSVLRTGTRVSNCLGDKWPSIPKFKKGLYKAIVPKIIPQLVFGKRSKINSKLSIGSKKMTSTPKLIFGRKAKKKRLANNAAQQRRNQVVVEPKIEDSKPSEKNSYSIRDSTKGIDENLCSEQKSKPNEIPTEVCITQTIVQKPPITKMTARHPESDYDVRTVSITNPKKTNDPISESNIKTHNRNQDNATELSPKIPLAAMITKPPEEIDVTPPSSEKSELGDNIPVVTPHAAIRSQFKDYASQLGPSTTQKIRNVFDDDNDSFVNCLQTSSSSQEAILSERVRDGGSSCHSQDNAGSQISCGFNTQDSEPYPDIPVHEQPSDLQNYDREKQGYPPHIEKVDDPFYQMTVVTRPHPVHGNPSKILSWKPDVANRQSTRDDTVRRGD